MQERVSDYERARQAQILRNQERMKALQLPSIAQQAVPDKPRREAKQRGISAKRKKAVRTTQQMRCSCPVCLLCEVLQLPVCLSQVPGAPCLLCHTVTAVGSGTRLVPDHMWQVTPTAALLSLTSSLTAGTPMQEAADVPRRASLRQRGVKSSGMAVD